MREIRLNPYDQSIYEREIRPLLPGSVFDAHCHLLPNRFHPRLRDTMPLACEDPMLGEVDLPYLEAWWKALLPDAEVRGMIMGFPTEDVDLDGENAFVAETVGERGYPFALMTRPETCPDRLEADIQRLRPAALKPYMCFVRSADPNETDIADLIPESLIAVAARRHLAVVLHVAKAAGMADPDNLRDVARLVGEYPGCNFVLAHCGRCFITPNMEAALDGLPVAENLWLDTSAVCDMGVFISLLNRYDRGRILFGTDLVTAAAFRGSYIRLGMSWHLCTADMVTRAGGMADKTTFAAYESLCALCHAMRFCGVSARDRENIFQNNALGLFGTTLAME